MPNEELRYRGHRLRLKKATIAPDFGARTVLVADPWEYVDLWLRRQEKDRARFYWGQARDFATAAAGLPPTSAPLLSYYSMLNAVKALLEVNEVQFADRHGVGGYRKENGRGLTAEIVEFRRGGVFGALTQLLDEQSADEEEYNLKQLLYNLVWVHRAFSLTYRSAPELFVPILDPGFSRRAGSSEAWFTAFVAQRDRQLLTGTRMPNQYEWDPTDSLGLTIRETTRFRWRHRDTSDDNLTRLKNYHVRVRRRVTYINSSQWLWYIKRNVSSPDLVDHSSLVITFATMHRLSELARYEPHRLAGHLDAGHNWLLSEFISIALRQFVDEIAAEITGMDFMIPGTRL